MMYIHNMYHIFWVTT